MFPGPTQIPSPSLLHIEKQHDNEIFKKNVERSGIEPGDNTNNHGFPILALLQWNH